MQKQISLAISTIRKIAIFATLGAILTACQSTALHTSTKNDTPTQTPYRTSSQILQSAPAEDWYFLDQNNLLYLTLANDQSVIIELNDTFAPRHSAQIRLLARHGHWDNSSVYRVQDNYVAQWGTFDLQTDKSSRPLPQNAAAHLPAELSLPKNTLQLDYTLPDRDAYSDQLGFVGGFPVAIKDNQAFIVHCYGIVGAARDNAPDSSLGEDLYAIIGQPARNLDRQIIVVGRVVLGIEHLSSLPRGKDSMGFYTQDQKPTTIIRAVMGGDLPKDQQRPLQALKTGSPSFHNLVQARRHLQGEWFANKTSGGIGVCDIPPTIRSNT